MNLDRQDRRIKKTDVNLLIRALFSAPGPIEDAGDFVATNTRKTFRLYFY